MSTGTNAQGGPAEARAERAEEGLPPETAAFYRAMIEALRSVDVPFLVGGAYAFARYTGIERHTKDFDIFVRAEDVNRVMATLAGAGCATELTFPHWLGKAYCGSDFIDVIFRSANGLAAVDEDWFAHAVEDEVLGLPVRLIPREEMLWSKAFVMERERYDGADVNHLLRAAATDLDWRRVLRRFGEHWPVLLSHLVLFGYVYPAEARKLPRWVMRDLLGRAEADLNAPAAEERVCRGSLISGTQYLIDIQEWGYRDARLHSSGGPMTGDEVREWTEALDQDG
ncbi:MAG: nucleotidyltransferase family protein [Chloroflexota bacterium]|nr:nucleotidyltransferase family protein [Chloroflexota bacterium]